MRVLDLFCSAGGSAMGIHQALPDAEIVGIDNRPQPRYPFAFVQADAMTFPLDGFDFIWASPPCQGYSITRALRRENDHPLLIPEVRARLRAASVPYIIENVAGAPLHASVRLCGTMFGLRVLRHRFFETSWLIPQPHHDKHVGGTGGSSHGSHYSRLDLHAYVCVAGHVFRSGDAQIAMGIDWTSQRDELAQAIPPAYSRYLLSHLPQAVPA